MLRNVNLKFISLSLGFGCAFLGGLNFSNANLKIEKIYESDTKVEFKVNSNNESEYIILPGGNKIKKNEVAFVTTSNGTYTFSEHLKDNSVNEESISITNLRSNLLVTPTPNVKLELGSTDTLSGVEHMRFKNEADGQWSEFEAYRTEKLWTLKNEGGERTVYAQYKDRAGNISDDVQDSIFLDLIGPTSTLFKINDGALYTNNENVKLSINATDNYSTVSKMGFSNNNVDFTEFDYATEANWTIPNTDGVHRVYLKLTDGVGNVGPINAPSINQASITLDKTLPSGTIDIIDVIQNESGDYVVPTPDVTLNIQSYDTLSGVKEINLYEGGHKTTLPNISQGNASQTVQWKLNTNTPTTKITLEVIDKAGNVYRTDSVIVTVLSLKIVDFYIDNIFNPSVFKGKFNRLSWYGSDETTPRPAGFPRQPMVAGGDVDFSLEYDINESVLSSYDMNWRYIVTITKPDNTSTVHESEVISASDEDKGNKLIRGKYKIPYNTPKDSIISIQVELDVTCHTTSGGTFSQKAIFPIGGGKAQIGEITGDIREDIKFNEIE